MINMVGFKRSLFVECLVLSQMVGESARWSSRLLLMAAGGCHQEVSFGAKRDYSIMYTDNYSKATLLFCTTPRQIFKKKRLSNKRQTLISKDLLNVN